jgi:hypothetical protein
VLEIVELFAAEAHALTAVCPRAQVPVAPAESSDELPGHGRPAEPFQEDLSAP